MSDDPGSTPPSGGSLPPPPPGAVPPPPPGAVPPLRGPGGLAGPPPPTGGAWPTATAGEPPSGSRAGYIIGAVIAALAIIGVVAFFLTRDDDDESVSSDSVADSVLADPTNPDDGAAEVTVPGDTGGEPSDLTLPDQTASERGGDIPPPTEEPTGLGDDAELNRLANDCYDGDMEACDTLYDQSERGSDYERYGDTCAGRQPADTLVYCTVTFSSD